MTLPGKEIAPDEWNLESLVEALAKERLTQENEFEINSYFLSLIVELTLKIIILQCQWPAI